MKTPEQDSLAEQLMASLLATFFALFGWFTLWQGGVTLKGKSGAVSFVGGRAGVAVAGFAFVVATFGVALLLRSCRANRQAFYLAGAVVLLPPMVFVLVRH